MICITAGSAPPSLGSFTPLSEDTEPVPGVRAGRAVEGAGGLADGAKLLLGAAGFFGITASETKARGRWTVADLADAVESGETTDVRCGTAGLAGAVDEGGLTDVEADSVDDRTGGPVGFAGASDVLRVGGGMEGVGLGGMVVFEDGAEMDFFTAMGLDGGAGLGVEGLAEMEGVVEGGTALATPVPNLPEFKICNAGGACQKANDKRRGRSEN